MTYTYSAYNLTIESELPLPELVPLTNHNGNGKEPSPNTTVAVRLGTVPAALGDPIGEGVLYQASANQFLLKLDHIARYLVQNGNEIIVQPAPDALASDVRVFMLGAGFGALLHQRETLVIHASAIWTAAGAVLFCGPSGVGKSTLLGELLNRGYPMMVDDVCGVVLDGTGQPHVLPAYPRTRLWADAAKQLQIETEGLERTRPTLEKYERQLPDCFWDQPTPLRHIYQLTTTKQDELTLTPLSTIDTFNAVLHNTYRHAFLDGLAMRQPHFRMVAAVASQMGVSCVVRPSSSFKLKELADRIEEDLETAVQTNQEFRKGESSGETINSYQKAAC